MQYLKCSFGFFSFSYSEIVCSAVKSLIKQRGKFNLIHNIFIIASMATSITSRQCAKCKDDIGSFSCEGCKEIFCIKHCIEHRQELANNFEQLMTEHNDIIQQIQEKEPQNELSKTRLLDQIDQWENTIIKKVHERAEQIRQRFTELINNENELVIDNMQALTDEIRPRNEKQDFLEHDIERIRGSINQIQIAINKSIQLSDIELYVESENIIDWERLIYVKQKLPTTSSSVINKQSTDQHTKKVENTINSNLPSSFVSFFASNYISPPVSRS